MSAIRPLSTRPLLAAIAVLLVAAAPASAGARDAVPPGHSGASQYTETLPTGGGETPTSSVHPGGVGGPGDGGGPGGGNSVGGTSGATPEVTPTQALGAHHAKQLEKLGPEGKAAARLAASAGAPAAHAAASHGGGDGSSPVKQVVGELTGTSSSEGMGILLPLLIVMTALVAVTFIFARRRPASPRD
ncbi:MAG TPA: hypothetical protein VH853_20015 [Polyangia bacterium]|jgi:hypothetical protein|nr:hypothetical protein [Polyangia bacterium]